MLVLVAVCFSLSSCLFSTSPLCCRQSVSFYHKTLTAPPDLSIEVPVDTSKLHQAAAGEQVGERGWDWFLMMDIKSDFTGRHRHFLCGGG